MPTKGASNEQNTRCDYVRIVFGGSECEIGMEPVHAYLPVGGKQLMDDFDPRPLIERIREFNLLLSKAYQTATKNGSIVSKPRQSSGGPLPGAAMRHLTKE
jgi:hypothetical protein